MKTKRDGPLNSTRVVAGIALIILSNMLYDDFTTTGMLQYHYLPFTSHLAGLWGYHWPFKITLVVPLVLLIVFNVALWKLNNKSYIYIQSFLLTLLAFPVISSTAEVIFILRVFSGINLYNFLPSIPLMIAPLFWGREILLKGLIAFLFYEYIKKWHKKSIQEAFNTCVSKKELLVGGVTLLSLLPLSIKAEQLLAGKFCLPPQNYQNELVVTMDFVRQAKEEDNIFAVWLEDSEHNYLQTLYVSQSVIITNSGARVLPKWQEAISKAGVDSKDIKMGAETPKTGKLTYVWKGINYKGEEINGEEGRCQQFHLYVEGFENKEHTLKGYHFDPAVSSYSKLWPDMREVIIIREDRRDDKIKNVQGLFVGKYYQEYKKLDRWKDIVQMCR